MHQECARQYEGEGVKDHGIYSPLLFTISQHDEEEYMEDYFYNSDDPSAPDGTKLARLVVHGASE